MLTLRMRRAAQACGLGALLASAANPAAAIDVTSDPVLYWNQVMVANGFPGSPTTGSRSYAMVGTAIYEAANATTGHGGYSYLGLGVSGGDTRAAVSQAARDVLVAVNPGATTQYDLALTNSLALISDPVARTAGRTTGSAIAAGVIGLRTGDGSPGTGPYVAGSDPGDWRPTAPSPAALPLWGQVDPWVLGSADQFRPAGPPALTSLEYALAFNEVKSLGVLGSAARTPDQTSSANFWNAANGTGPWISAGLGAAESQGLSTFENAQLFGLLSVTIADAVIATWDAKYEYEFWRPITAIRMGDLDGNAATLADPAWTSLIAAPNHPSYLSAHSAVAGAASSVLGSFLGDANPFCLTAGAQPQRCWGSFSAAATDAANSRLWGGIHFAFDNADGLTLGRDVAGFTLASRTFDAVPEPSTWAMMILGFLGAGVMLRRGSRRASSQAAA